MATEAIKDRTRDRSAPPTDQLKSSVQNLAAALGKRAVSSVTDRLGSVTGRLTDYAESGGGGAGLKAAMTGAKKLAEGKSPAKSMMSAGMSGLMATVKGKAGKITEGIKQAFGGGGKGRKGKKLKVTNIVEQIDVGAPVQVVYDQWTQFTQFPDFMKKVENVEQEADEKLSWKAQVFWSHRTWESTILDQVPEERIVWRSKGAKGFVDGAVTFHELAPDLTRVLVVLEYHPQGLFERTGNLWRAQGRRVRLELKHFRRHLMTQTLLHADEVEGWRGEIHDGQVVKPHEEEPEGAEGREERGKPEEPERAEDRDRAEGEERGHPERERPERERRARAEREPEEEEEERPVPSPRGGEERRRAKAAATGRSNRRRE